MVEVPDVVPRPGPAPGQAPGQASGVVPASLSAEQVEDQLTLLLMHLVDVLPDPVLVASRGALVAGDLGRACRALVLALRRQRSALSAVEHAVLRECLDALGEDPTAAAELPLTTLPTVGAELQADPWAAPGPGRRDGVRTAAGSPGETHLAGQWDDLVLSRVAEDALGVWRSWRLPSRTASWPAPRPVYLVEAVDRPAARRVQAQAYGAMPLCGADDGPLVEVYPCGVDLPAGHMAMQVHGALIHAPMPAAGFRFAEVFEPQEGTGGRPRFRLLDPAEVRRLSAYLEAGTPVMQAGVAARDVVRPDRPPQVPLHLLTDGTWIWSEATRYYLTRYRVAPAADFLAHLRDAVTTPARVSDVRRHQALTWLSGRRTDGHRDGGEHQA